MRYTTVFASALLFSGTLASAIDTANVHLGHHGDNQATRHEVVERMHKAHMGKRTGPSPSPHPSKLKVRKVESKTGESLEELEFERERMIQMHGQDASHPLNGEEHGSAPLKQATRSQVIERMQHHVKRTGPSASPMPVKREHVPTTIQAISDDSDAYDYTPPSYVLSTASMNASHEEHGNCSRGSVCDDKDTEGMSRRVGYKRPTVTYPVENLADSTW